MIKRKTTPKANALLKKYGYISNTVERQYGGFLHDWLGFADILGFRVVKDNGFSVVCSEFVGVDFSGCLAVQCCTSNNLTEHIDKVLNEDTKKGIKRKSDLKEFLDCGANRFEIWAFPRADWIKKNPTTKQEDYLKVRRIFIHDGEFFIMNKSELSCFGFESKET